MSDNKFYLYPKKYQGSSSVVSIRLPDELIKTLDSIAETTGRTRNEIIQKSLTFAIENLEIM